MPEKKVEPAKGPQSDVSEMLRGLHEFVGEWKVVQKVWAEADAPPVINHGRTSCRSILGGAATLMITEMETTSFKGVALLTYNPKLSQFDMAWMDSMSDEGIALMRGASARQRSREGIRAEFGKAATAQREWTSGPPAQPGKEPLEANAAVACVGTALGDRVELVAAPTTLRMVENKISSDHWVLDFFLSTGAGEQLVQQNNFLRAAP